MKILSIDIESSGLNPDRHQILSLGCVLYDTDDKTKVKDLPSFYRVIKHGEIVGQPYALALNAELINMMKDKESFKHETFSTYAKILSDLYRWLVKELTLEYFTNGNILTIAGKNFTGFDLQFIKKLPHYESYFKSLVHSHRVIDPAILYVNWSKDKCLPNLQTCLDRAGIDKNVTHNALEDACDIVRLLQYKI